MRHTGEDVAWRSQRVPFGRSPAALATYESGRADAEAPALLLVHGLGHWAEAAWTPLAREFGRTHRIVTFDLPGFGASVKPDAPYPLALFVDAVRQVAESAGLERFGLVGHSLGGLVAAAYAAAEPDRVRALGLIDPAGFLRTPTLALRVLASRPVEALFGRLRPSRGVVRRALASAVFDPATIGDAMHAEAYGRLRERDVVRAFARVYAGAMQELVHMGALHRRLAVWRGPTLLVWGREDRYVPVRALARARLVYPDAAVLLLERCGHCPNLEFPGAVAEGLVRTGI